MNDDDFRKAVNDIVEKTIESVRWRDFGQKKEYSLKKVSVTRIIEDFRCIVGDYVKNRR